jgi:hypothetical protein
VELMIYQFYTFHFLKHLINHRLGKLSKLHHVEDAIQELKSQIEKEFLNEPVVILRFDYLSAKLLY